MDEPHAESQLFAPSFCFQAPLQVLVSIDEFRARSLTGFPDVEGIETWERTTVALVLSLTGFPDVEGIETVDAHRLGEIQRLTGFPDVEGIETGAERCSSQIRWSDRLP